MRFETVFQIIRMPYVRDYDYANVFEERIQKEVKNRIHDEAEVVKFDGAKLAANLAVKVIFGLPGFNMNSMFSGQASMDFKPGILFNFGEDVNKTIRFNKLRTERIKIGLMLGSNSDVSSAMYREARIDGLDLKAPLNDTWLFKKIIG